MSNRRKSGSDGYEVLAFLDHHRLPHTPDHFAFAHDYLNGDDAEFRARIDGEIDGGVRLTADQVERLRPSVVPRALLPEIDHITLRVLDVVGDAMAITTDLNRELVTASATLLDAPGNAVGPLLATLLHRAEEAEASFAQAAHRARSIRSELAALQAIGQHDPLTGLINRTGLEKRLADHSRSQACFALIDIDGLRRINGSHSVAVGDRLLKVVARSLTDQCSAQLVGRWDGGTFAVLIETSDLRAAAELISSACEAIRVREMKVRESDAPLGSISLSAAVVAVRSRAAHTVIEAVQDQLRGTKQRGRGLISVEGTVVAITNEDQG